MHESKRITRKTSEPCSHIHYDIVKAMVIKKAVQLYFQLEKSNKRYRYLHRFAKKQQQQKQQQQQQKTNKQTQKPE